MGGENSIGMVNRFLGGIWGMFPPPTVHFVIRGFSKASVCITLNEVSVTSLRRESTDSLITRCSEIDFGGFWQPADYHSTCILYYRELC